MQTRPLSIVDFLNEAIPVGEARELTLEEAAPQWRMALRLWHREIENEVGGGVGGALRGAVAGVGVLQRPVQG